MAAIKKACVVGSGPNGLAAAVVLAQAGLQVDVFEAEPTPGGAARTMELTLPGFLHDFGSAVHPLAVGSPFFSSLPLQDHGLEWSHSPAPVAHPLDDGTAVVLERDLQAARISLGTDGDAWANLMRPFVDHWPEFAPEVLRPIRLIPRHPLLMARFGLSALFSAQAIAQRFRSERTRALFAGLAAHSFLGLDEPLSGAFGMLMAVSAHAVGWPIPRAGAQSLTNALCGVLSTFGVNVRTSSRVGSLAALPEYDLILCDVTPRQLLRIAGGRLSESYRVQLSGFRYGEGVFKVDYALNGPIPWKAPECLRAATVHLGGTFEEIAAAEMPRATGSLLIGPLFCWRSRVCLMLHGLPPENIRRGPIAMCRMGQPRDMLPQDRSADRAFRAGVSGLCAGTEFSRRADSKQMDANLVGGDIGAALGYWGSFCFVRRWRHYATSARDVYICSASTPPGGGVHGMCGYHAARAALSRLGPG